MTFISEDRVCLLLLREEENEERDEEDGKSEVWFYLDIPLDDIDPLCQAPRRYLLYIAWCIVGHDADDESLSLAVADEDGEFHRIDLEGDLEGGGIYTVIAAASDPYAGMYSSVPDERAVIIHGFSGPRGHQGADGRTF